jgi:hypothetical protein
MTSPDTEPWSSPPSGTQEGGRRSRRRWLRTFLITLLVLVILAVAADFAARFVAQAEVASKIQQQGFPQKPSVTIEGFPFLTQVASRDIQQVRIGARNITEGPLLISKVSAVLTGIHLNSGFSSGTVDQLNGSLLITFPALANTLTSQIGPLGSLVGASGLKLSQAGPGEVKASLSLLVVSASAIWQVSRLSGQELRIRLVSSNGLPSGVLDSIKDVTIHVPQLPLGVKIASVSVTPAGISATISGRNLPFGTHS